MAWAWRGWNSMESSATACWPGFAWSFASPRAKWGGRLLIFGPPAPQGLDGKAMSGMDAIGGIMKLVGALLGKNAEQPVVLRGFLGIGLEDTNNAVVVKTVLAGSPAANAGLQIGDQLNRF